MEKHLGRNPFKKARTRHKPRPKVITGNENSPLEWLMIQLPAKALVMVIKTGILVKTVFDKRPDATK
jgi:hypothetical protein